MSQAIWISQTGGDWSDPENWQGTIVPGPGDSVTITSTVAETITISTAVTVQSLVLDDPAATFELLNTGTIIATGDVDIDAQAVSLDGAVVSGATVDITSETSIAALRSISASQVILNASDVTLNSSVTAVAGALATDIATVLNLGVVDTLAVSDTVVALFDNNVTLEIASVETSQPLIPWTVESDGSIILTGDVTDDGDVTVSCFAAGTRIGTPDGPAAVERLVAGGIVSLADGGAAPIIWIGRRHVDCRRHPAPERVWPVRIAAHAFGLGRPQEALFLSPDHAVFIDDVLVPVKLLVNGATIRQVPVASVTYYHLELARHDVVLAEGLPVETYLDTGGRAAFEHGVMTLHPEFGAPDDVAVAIWRQKGFAPLIGDVTVLERLRVRLAVQAGLLADRRAG